MASLLKSLSRQFSFLPVCILASSLPAMAAPDVVTSIAPVHSIAAAIMKGVGEPHLLIPSSASPHSADLRPSGAKALQEADLVFWVGPRIEAFLVKPLETLAIQAKAIALVKAEGVALLPTRSGGNWETHDHPDHDEHEDHDDHDDHDHHDDHDDHKETEKHDDHAQTEHDDHEETAMDNHIWLSPSNGLAMATAITNALSEADPDNAKTYQANNAAFQTEVTEATEEAKGLLADHKAAPFIVFHDAYQYFEAAFDVSAIGSITLNPGVNPGAARVREIHEKLRQLGAACLLSEPQFSSSLSTILTEGTNTRQGQLDPMGKALEQGPTLYPELIRFNARELAACLKKD